MVAVRTRVLSAELPLFAAFLFSILLLSWSNAMAAGKENFSIPILVYHRLGPTVTDRMTVTVSLFESQLRSLIDNDYKIIPLRQLVQDLLTGAPTLPPRSCRFDSEAQRGAMIFNVNAASSRSRSWAVSRSSNYQHWVV
jgi:hypothetical protein